MESKNSDVFCINLSCVLSFHRSLVFWGGHAGNWGVNNFLVFNWDTKTFTRENRHRHGGNEGWPTFAAVSTKYFTDLDCINARWSSCVEWDRDRPGSDTHQGSKETLEDCGDWCGSLQTDCEGYQFIANDKYCYLKKPTPNSVVALGKHYASLQYCYYHWYGSETVQQP